VSCPARRRGVVPCPASGASHLKKYQEKSTGFRHPKMAIPAEPATIASWRLQRWRLGAIGIACSWREAIRAAETDQQLPAGRNRQIKRIER
jgi:hypothetical protein